MSELREQLIKEYKEDMEFHAQRALSKGYDFEMLSIAEWLAEPLLDWEPQAYDS